MFKSSIVWSLVGILLIHEACASRLRNHPNWPTHLENICGDNNDDRIRSEHRNLCTPSVVAKTCKIFVHLFILQFSVAAEQPNWDNFHGKFTNNLTISTRKLRLFACSLNRMAQIIVNVTLQSGKANKIENSRVFSFKLAVNIFLHGATKKHINCGGTLITEQHVVSAAHCTEPYKP